MKKKNLKNIIILASFVIFPVLFGCSSSKNVDYKPESVYNEAMKKFKNEDYLEAQKLFDVIRLQFRATQYEDDAQYYLAETYFMQEQFVMAAFNYSYLRRAFPNSEFAKESLFKTGLSYYNLSPDYDRDQDYTNKAIQTFQEFQYNYPGDSLFLQATNYIQELRDKLGHRDFFTAELYRKLYSPKSSLVYFDSVIQNFSDTKFYEPALMGKIEVLYQLKRYDEAVGIIRLYKNIFPNGNYTLQVNKIENDINNIHHN